MNTEEKKKQLNSAIFGILEDFKGSVQRKEDDFDTAYHNLMAELMDLLDVIYDDPSLPALEDIDTMKVNDQHIGTEHQVIGGGSSNIVLSPYQQIK
jgi:hypothetical protein